ncbi:hypothetical protein B0H13DRAFT_2568162 [Mycena leptocephala]|nr:hypothetical protein B0H13DRAFT_2568162 [Mycena leptocephala]
MSFVPQYNIRDDVECFPALYSLHCRLISPPASPLTTSSTVSRHALFPPHAPLCAVCSNSNSFSASTPLLAPNRYYCTRLVRALFNPPHSSTSPHRFPQRQSHLGSHRPVDTARVYALFWPACGQLPAHFPRAYRCSRSLNVACPRALLPFHSGVLYRSLCLHPAGPPASVPASLADSRSGAFLASLVGYDLAATFTGTPRYLRHRRYARMKVENENEMEMDTAHSRISVQMLVSVEMKKRGCVYRSAREKERERWSYRRRSPIHLSMGLAHAHGDGALSSPSSAASFFFRVEATRYAWAPRHGHTRSTSRQGTCAPALLVRARITDVFLCIRSEEDFGCRCARSRVGGGGDGWGVWVRILPGAGSRRRRCTRRGEHTRSLEVTPQASTARANDGTLLPLAETSSRAPLFLSFRLIVPMFALRPHTHRPSHPALRSRT